MFSSLDMNLKCFNLFSNITCIKNKLVNQKRILCIGWRECFFFCISVRQGMENMLLLRYTVLKCYTLLFVIFTISTATFMLKCLVFFQNNVNFNIITFNKIILIHS